MKQQLFNLGKTVRESRRMDKVNLSFVFVDKNGVSKGFSKWVGAEEIVNIGHMCGDYMVDMEYDRACYNLTGVEGFNLVFDVKDFDAVDKGFDRAIEAVKRRAERRSSRPARNRR